MTVPELFRQERRFVGCLAIRRLASSASTVASRHFHSLPATPGFHADLFTQALASATSQRGAPREASADTTTERRRALEAERRFWGERVFGYLRRDLFDQPERVQALPLERAFTLSIGPVLAALADTSERCRIRVRAYAGAQVELISSIVHALPARRDTPERIELERLRAFERTHRSLLRGLDVGPHVDAGDPAFVRDLETWLGC